MKAKFSHQMRSASAFLFLASIAAIMLANSPCAMGQKLIFKETYKSIVNVDENNWAFAVEFKAGDTVDFVGISRTDKEYFIVRNKIQTVFVYRNTVIEADNYFEQGRLKMDRERKFVLDKNNSSIKRGDTVTILNAIQGSAGIRIAKISNGVSEAAVNLDDLNLRPYLQNEVNLLIEKSNEAIANDLKRINEERAKKLKAKYGQALYKRIMLSEIWIGMTDEMARESQGAPRVINKTVSASGKREQWVYENRYLYFENERLTSWQESK